MNIILYRYIYVAIEWRSKGHTSIITFVILIVVAATVPADMTAILAVILVLYKIGLGLAKMQDLDQDQNLC